jgi:hypothetical protein
MNLQVKKIFASDWNFIAPTFCTLIASTIFLSKSNKASNLSPLSLRQSRVTRLVGFLAHWAIIYFGQLF